MFCIKAHSSILEHNEVYGLVKPPKEKMTIKMYIHYIKATQRYSSGSWRLTKTGRRWSLLTHAMVFFSPVITLPVEQRFSVTIQGLHRVFRIIALLCVIQCNKESSLLHSIQRLLVLAVSEVGITGTCPRHSETDRYRQKLLLNFKMV